MQAPPYTASPGLSDFAQFVETSERSLAQTPCLIAGLMGNNPSLSTQSCYSGLQNMKFSGEPAP
jgi:hypothetical protein